MKPFSEDSKTICIIPARSGSVRFPDKNIALFIGKPLMAYSITNAINAGVFDHVIVTTDSEEYASIAESAGATPFMRAARSTDHEPLSVPVEEVVAAYSPDKYAILPTCAVMADTHGIRATYIDSETWDDATDCVPVRRAEEQPEYMYRFVHGKLSRETFVNKNTQELPTYFYPVPFISWHLNMKDKAELMGYYVPPPHVYHDVHTERDLAILENKYHLWHKGRNRQ